MIDDTITLTDPAWQRLDIPPPLREWIAPAPLEAVQTAQLVLGPVEIEPGGGPIPLPAAVPEPAGVYLLLIGAIGIVAARSIWRHFGGAR